MLIAHVKTIGVFNYELEPNNFKPITWFIFCQFTFSILLPVCTWMCAAQFFPYLLYGIFSLWIRFLFFVVYLYALSTTCVRFDGTCTVIRNVWKTKCITCKFNERERIFWFLSKGKSGICFCERVHCDGVQRSKEPCTYNRFLVICFAQFFVWI